MLENNMAFTLISFIEDLQSFNFSSPRELRVFWRQLRTSADQYEYTIRWRQPEHPNGKLLKYIISCEGYIYIR